MSITAFESSLLKSRSPESYHTSEGYPDDFSEKDLPLEKIEIKILGDDESRHRWDAQTMNVIRAVDAGRPMRPKAVLGFDSLESLRKFLTPQRQLLYRVLKRKQPQSVYELAKMLGRDRKAVAEDLKVLQEMMLVRFRTTVHNGRARLQPVLTHKRLVIEFA
ncbi:MAG TPA: HTH domain-containing protein [Candidatus Thermoplasmatota archaeon]|nr:HTH domain-containing protein [Candidatus Thermoplasmatota archaeon]